MPSADLRRRAAELLAAGGGAGDPRDLRSCSPLRRFLHKLRLSHDTFPPPRLHGPPGARGGRLRRTRPHGPLQRRPPFVPLRRHRLSLRQDAEKKGGKALAAAGANLATIFGPASRSATRARHLEFVRESCVAMEPDPMSIGSRTGADPRPPLPSGELSGEPFARFLRIAEASQRLTPDSQRS
jgi:hypothetical protein